MQAHQLMDRFAPTYMGGAGSLGGRPQNAGARSQSRSQRRPRSAKDRPREGPQWGPTVQRDPYKQLVLDSGVRVGLAADSTRSLTPEPKAEP